MPVKAMPVGDYMLVKGGEVALCEEVVAGGAAF